MKYYYEVHGGIHLRPTWTFEENNFADFLESGYLSAHTAARERHLLHEAYA
jgi:hypothetical protein